jgi:hypothetical protein
MAYVHGQRRDQETTKAPSVPGRRPVVPLTPIERIRDTWAHDRTTVFTNKDDTVSRDVAKAEMASLSRFLDAYEGRDRSERRAELLKAAALRQRAAEYDPANTSTVDRLAFRRGFIEMAESIEKRWGLSSGSSREAAAWRAKAAATDDRTLKRGYEGLAKRAEGGA